MAPVVLVFDDVNVWVAFAPEVKSILAPEVLLPIAVFPETILRFNGAPLSANVPEEVIVAVDSPVELMLPDVDVKLSAPVVCVNPLEAVKV